MQNFFALIISEVHVPEFDIANDVGEDDGALWIDVLRPLVQHLARTFQSRESFGDLRSNRDYLQHRSYQEAHEHGVSEKAAKGQRSRDNLASAEIHHDCAHNTEQDGGR